MDRAALLQRHGTSAGEFAKITSSMTDLCFDVLVRNSPMCVSIYVLPALYCVYQIERRLIFTSRVSRPNDKGQTVVTTDSRGACQWHM